MKVAIIVDKIGWVQFDRAIILKKILPFHIEIKEKISTRESNKFDAIYFSNVGLMKKNIISNNRILSSITSHKTAIDPSLSIYVEKCKKCSVNSKLLFDIVSNKIECNKLEYIPNGVNTSFFCYKEKEVGNPIRIGWVGNKDRDTKNFYTILKPLINRLKNRIRFDIVATTKSSGKYKTSEEMKALYYGIDFLLVTSSTEGTPNPALEAMSCGTPVITTPVGNMPELVKHGESGYFVNPLLKNFVSFFNNFKINTNEYNCMQKMATSSVEKWDWSFRRNDWMRFFE